MHEVLCSKYEQPLPTSHPLTSIKPSSETDFSLLEAEGGRGTIIWGYIHFLSWIQNLEA